MSMKEHEINCEEITCLLESYAQGKLEDVRSLQVEEHIQNCAQCKTKLDNIENKLFISADKNDLLENDSLRKIENKFIFKISRNVIGIICGIAIGWYLLFIFILPILFSNQTMKKSQQVEYVLQDLILFTSPGAKISNLNNSSKNGLINIYKNIQFEMPAVQGKVKVQKYDIAVPMYIGSANLRSVTLSDNNCSSINFTYNQKNDTTGVWEKISSFGKGTKTSIAIHFDKSLALDEVKKILMLTNADTEHSWLPIDLTALKPKNVFMKINVFSPQWGLPLSMLLTPTTADNITYDDKGNVTSMGKSVAVYDLKKITEDFKKEMQYFEKNSVILGDNTFTQELHKINAFLKSNPIKIKGAILTAATEDILKLQNQSNISGVEIIKVDFNY